MSVPRHLWSGDWQDESAALRDELAARRSRAANSPALEHAEREPAECEPAAPSPRRPAINRRHLRLALVLAALALTGVAGAYGLGSALGGGDSATESVLTRHSRAWLGVDTSSSQAGGVIVDSVMRGGPAAAAGIRPGDVITALDTQPIDTPAILLSAIDGMQPGDRVQLQLRRGGTAYTAEVVLARRPGRSP